MANPHGNLADHPMLHDKQFGDTAGERQQNFFFGKDKGTTHTHPDSHPSWMSFTNGHCGTCDLNNRGS